MIFIHWLACVVQIFYNMYNITMWHTMRVAVWAHANWHKRDRFIASYRPSTEEERLYEERINNRSNAFRYRLKKRMLEPFEPADETDPVWGRINKKYNVDNQDKR